MHCRNGGFLPKHMAVPSMSSRLLISNPKLAWPGRQQSPPSGARFQMAVTRKPTLAETSDPQEVGQQCESGTNSGGGS